MWEVLATYFRQGTYNKIFPSVLSLNDSKWPLKASLKLHLSAILVLTSYAVFVCFLVNIWEVEVTYFRQGDVKIFTSLLSFNDSKWAFHKDAIVIHVGFNKSTKYITEHVFHFVFYSSFPLLFFFNDSKWPILQDTLMLALLIFFFKVLQYYFTRHFLHFLFCKVVATYFTAVSNFDYS